MVDPAMIAGLLGLAGGVVLATPCAWWWCRRRFTVACRLATDPDVPAEALPSGLRELTTRGREAVETARRGASLGLRIAEERSARATRVVELLEDPVLILDASGLVVERNAAADRLPGADGPGEDRTVESFLGTIPAAREIRDLARGLREDAKGAARRISFVLVGDEGDRDFDATIRRLDEVGRTVLVLRETTREREMARIRSEFVAKASHELRTPLSSIRATLELLEEGDLEEPAVREEMLTIATEESDRLSRLVDDMLDITRIEAGVARPTIEPVDLGELATEVVEGIRAAAERRDLVVEARIEGEGLGVEGDRDMLATVIGNLVGNAVKYVPAGERITVAVAPEDLTRSVVVTVTDTGLGIPPDDLPRIFEKFYRVSRYERRARGTGLGLDLCRNIVEQVHHGRIGVDSTLGEGARFWFGVPALHASSVAA